MAGHGGKRAGAGRKSASPYPQLQQALRNNEGLFVAALNEALLERMPWALRFVGERLCAPLRATAQHYTIPNLQDGDSPQVIAQKTLEAMAQGRIPAEYAQAQLNCIRSLVELSELAEIKQKIQQLEARYG